MRNEIVEWMLSQVATAEQARTVLGDLLEAQPGPAEFWVGVVRAIASFTGHDPRRTLISLTGFAIQFGFLAVLAWVISAISHHRFFAIYGVLAGLFILWRAVVGFAVRCALLRFGKDRFFLNIANAIYYGGVSALFVWCLMRYAGQSLWSAMSVLIFGELFALWRSRRKRVAESRKIA